MFKKQLFDILKKKRLNFQWFVILIKKILQFIAIKISKLIDFKLFYLSDLELKYVKIPIKFFEKVLHI